MVRPLRYGGRVLVGIATSPGRNDQRLEETISSLKDNYWPPGIDVLVHLNEAWGQPPGDLGKFSFAEEHNPFDYYLSCDDDLIYPKDYVSRTVNALDAAYEIGDWEHVITYHGKSLKIQRGVKIQSFYMHPSEDYRCLLGFEQTVFVDIPGTGVMGMHRDAAIQFNDNLKERRDAGEDMLPNAADLYAGRFFRQRGYGVLCLEHPRGWIKYSPHMHSGDTIWDQIAKNPDLHRGHTMLAREIYGQ
jgi:hypothetical protein